MICLSRVVERLWRRPDVLAIWLGGSLAAGVADRYSDIDLRIAVDADAFPAWTTVDLPAIFDDPCPGPMMVFQTPNDLLYHVVLSDGELFDLYVQPFPPRSVDSPNVILAVRDESIRAQLEGLQEEDTVPSDVAAPEEVEKAIRSYWINTHKHRKVLNRDLDLLAQFGIRLEDDTLKRLWYVLLTGCDEPRRKSIHSLTAQTRAVAEGIGPRAQELLGMPLRSRAEMIAAIEARWNEISIVGRQLAEKLAFNYPSELEAVVRQGWGEWLAST